MPLLNQHSTYDDVSTEESRALFLGGRPLAHEVLHTGALLCRFVPRTASPAVSAWWIMFNPFRLENGTIVPGIGQFLLQSGCRINQRGMMQEGQDVKLSCMETGSIFAMVRLIESAYAFMGPTVPWRPEPCGGVMPLRGGEFRVWIPGLTANMLQPVPTPRALFIESPPTATEADLPGGAEHQSADTEPVND